ncbi:MAG TPA: carboxypeptidase-like regulatory domain-containing protein, partial [Terriglobales bacterium]|nr:carboxypeptidase-like regulatory domain-containing protein [Terriglobales bacterium]
MSSQRNSIQTYIRGILSSGVNGRHWLAASLAICLGLLFTMQVWAQEYRGLIIGQVTDSSGAVIRDAKITAKGPQQTYRTTSNASGDFSIPFVQPATYQVSVEAPGFKKSVERNVVISVAQ